MLMALSAPILRISLIRISRMFFSSSDINDSNRHPPDLGFKNFWIEQINLSETDLNIIRYSLIFKNKKSH